MAQVNLSQLSMISRLDGTNYVSWSMKCSLLLRREGLWDIIANPPDVSSWDPANDDDKEKLQDFKLKNEQALCIIGLTLCDQQLVHIRGEENAANCWENLRKIYVRDSVGAHINLTRKLFRTHLQRNGDMLVHLNCMKSIFQDLQEKELIFNELQQVYIILSSLDQSYDDYVTSLEVLPKESLSLTEITGRLLEEARRRRERDELREDKKEEKLSSKLERNQQSKVKHLEEENLSSTAYTIKKCFNCGGRGHLARFCKKRKSQNVKKPKKAFELATFNNSDVKNNLWVVDSGASHCITRDKTKFIKMSTSSQHISLANGWNLKAKGQGFARCPYINQDIKMLYVPQLKFNLLSVRVLDKLGYVITFKDNNCIIEKDNKRVTAALNGTLYVLDNSKKGEAQTVFNNIKPHEECIHLLHRRLGHVNFKMLKRTVELSEGIRLKPCDKYLRCNVCCEDKSKVLPANRLNGFKTKEPLEVVFADIIGPKKPSMGGARYILSIMDHYSRYGFCYLMKSKTETYQHFFNWLRFAERKSKRQLITLVTDNGTEFINNKFQNRLKVAGIEHKKSAPYRPEHNAFIERRGQTLQAMVRTMLNDSGLPDSLWGEATMCANNILNNVVNTTTGEIPFTRWHGRKPDLSYLHTFGAPAWVHIPAQLRKKGQHRAKRFFFVGYQANHRAYRFWEKGTSKVLCSASAQFLEHEGWEKLEQDANKDVIIESYRNPISYPCNFKNKVKRQIQDEIVPIKEETDSIAEQDEEDEQVVVQQSPPVSPVIPRRTTRISRPPDRYQANTVCQINQVPNSVEEIKKYPNKEKERWYAAMNKELNSLSDMKVYENAKLPVGKKSIGCKWIFKVKTDKDGNLIHKARLVAQGFRQNANDYDEVFAPSLKAATLRAALVWAASKNYIVNHLDVETAYLHAPLKHTIYMKKPVGIKSENKDNNDCWLLKKSLYGLKQSGYEWNQYIVKELNNIGFRAGLADPCLFKRETNGKISLLLLFTDDIALITETNDEANKIIASLGKKIKIKQLGEIKKYLGLNIQKTQKGFKISQEDKICKLLIDYKMELCKPAKTPMSQEFSNTDAQSPGFDKVIYQSLIGSLSYISNWSRPDISYSVNQLARFNSAPSERHWIAAKRILRYLKKTMNYSLYLEPKGDLILSAYADASFASERDTRKSTSGTAIMLGKTLIGWKSIRQQHISLSTMEAEFSCLSLLCTELIMYKQMMNDIGITVNYPIIIHEDNQAAIQMATNIAVKTRSKHTDLRYLNVRQSVRSKMIQLEYCMSEDNVADNFTKAQGARKHQESCENYGVRL